MKLSSIDYLTHLVRITNKRAQVIRETKPPEQHRIFRRSYINYLITLKIYCRRLQEEFNSGKYNPYQFAEKGMEAGEFLFNLLRDVNTFQEKLSESEYQAIFNINQKKWNDNYFGDTPQDAGLIVIALSEEPMVDFLIANLLGNKTHDQPTNSPSH